MTVYGSTPIVGRADPRRDERGPEADERAEERPLATARRFTTPLLRRARARRSRAVAIRRNGPATRRGSSASGWSPRAISASSADARSSCPASVSSWTRLNQRPGVGDGRAATRSTSSAARPGVPHAPMRDDRRPVVGEARLEAQRLEEVQEQLGVLGALGRRSATHVLVPVLPEEDAQLVVGPPPQRRSGGTALCDLGHDHRPAQLLAGGQVGVAQADVDDLGQRRIGPERLLERAEPVLGAAALGVVARRETEPVALGMVVPVLAGDVVLDDPALLGRRPGEEHLGRDAESGDRAPLRLVPGAHRQRRRAAASPTTRGPGGLARLERPLEHLRAAHLEGVVVVEAAHRVAELGPRAVEHRGPAGGDVGRGRPVGVVPQDGLAEGGAQLARPRRRARPRGPRSSRAPRCAPGSADGIL